MTFPPTASLRSCVAAAIALLLSLAGPAAAQNIPPLTALSAPVEASNPDLAGQRAALMLERAALHGKIDNLNARCGSVDKGSTAAASCMKDQAQLLAALNSHIQKSNEFNTAARVAIQGPIVPNLASNPNAAKFCAGKQRVAADERALQQMNFANETSSFEMFSKVSADQRAQLQKKALDVLLDQGLKATTMAATSAKSLNPWNVNTRINELQAKGLNNDMIFSGLRRIAAAKDKPAMAEAYKDLLDAIQNTKEGYDTRKDMAAEPRSANLRLLIGVLKIAQGNPELGLAVTAADFGESLAYLGYISAQVDDLTQVTDDKLVVLKSRIDRLKQDVSVLNKAKHDWATTNGESGEPDCGT